VYVRFSDALKAFRRNAHVHQENWRCVIVVTNFNSLDIIFQETLNTMQGTSHATGMQVNYAARTITCANGASIRFCVANSMEDVWLRIKGLNLTHVILVGGASEHKLINYVLPNLHSNVVPPEEYRTDLCEGI
jgi:hypothetical protein